MVGKVPNLEPRSSGLRHKSTLRSYWSPYFAKWVTKSWPRGGEIKSEARLYYANRFKAATQVIKQVSGEDVQAAIDASKNTPLLTRDILMKAAMGNLIGWYDTEGNFHTGVHMANAEAQALLNSISNTPGTILIKTSQGWLGLLPPVKAGQALIFDNDQGVPQWLDQAGGSNAPKPPSLAQILDGEIIDLINGGNTPLVAQTNLSDTEVGEPASMDNVFGQSLSDGQCYMRYTVMPRSQVLNSLKFVALADYTSARIKPFIYSVNGSIPHQPLVSAAYTTGVAMGLNQFDFDAPLYVPKGAEIYIGFQLMDQAIAITRTTEWGGIRFPHTTDTLPTDPSVIAMVEPWAAFWASGDLLEA